MDGGTKNEKGDYPIWGICAMIIMYKNKQAKGGAAMTRHVGKKLILCLLLCAVCMLTACGFDSSVEELFTLPQFPVEYTGLSRQIDELVANGYEYSSPTGGRNIQSVQMVDLDNDGDQEAIAFFRKSDEAKPLKIFVFRPCEENYERLCVIESSGTGVDSVYYQDLNGDGRKELLVGWRISTDVQTVEAYDITNEPVKLVSSAYTRYHLVDLDSDDLSNLLVLRTDDEGAPVAEFYQWKDNALTVTHRSGLSSTMAELGRGGMVSGYIAEEQPAVFITGVNEKNMAVTDILTWRSSRLTNITADPVSGKSTAVWSYCQLMPQDLNGDGTIEMPYPQQSGEDADINGDGFMCWGVYDRWGRMRQVGETYHCQSQGWYMTVSEEYWGRMSAFGTESDINEKQTIFSLDSSQIFSVYTITGENRENRSERGWRFVLQREPSTIYTGEMYDSASRYGIDESTVNSSFNLIMNTWNAPLN